ncbi:hypothetical protein [Micromonospora sonneratiae]|uniref:Uncharacterized protein n=1 Tax=Micromonospora sonneratiae TaxID=1184706 RepID=A0ABW3YEW1_9ACTN
MSTRETRIIHSHSYCACPTNPVSPTHVHNETGHTDTGRSSTVGDLYRYLADDCGRASGTALHILCCC